MIKLISLRQAEINWLLENGVPPKAVISPTPMMLARGSRATDGRFEPAECGQVWFAIGQETDTVFWQPRTGEVAVDTGRAFALGEGLVDNPGATALGASLKIYAHPIEWLQASRNGLYVLPDRWPWCFEWLRNVERVAVSEEVLPLYRKNMKPRLPQLAVIPKTEARVA